MKPGTDFLVILAPNGASIDVRNLTTENVIADTWPAALRAAESKAKSRGMVVWQVTRMPARNRKPSA